MNTSGEAADQIVRMSLEAGEAALKISGAGARQLAVLLYAILKEQKKTRGRARLETLVRSGKPLTVFSVKESDLKKFVQEAKRYGILYCAVRDPKGSSDGMVDIMVKEEDAPRINRIVERFRFASVTEAAQIKTEIEKSREEKSHTEGKGRSAGKEEVSNKKRGVSEEKGMGPSGQERSGEEHPTQEQSKEDKLMEELFGEPAKKERDKPQNPSLAKTAKSPLSEPILEKEGKAAGGTSNLFKPATAEKESVREKLHEIQERKKNEAEGKSSWEFESLEGKSQKAQSQKSPEHKQPQGKKRTRKSKVR